MKHLVKIFLIGIVLFGCSKKNCVTSSDLAFYELNETDRSFYVFSADSFNVSIPKYITPNNDSVNDFFEVQTNIGHRDYISSKLTVVNSCEDVVHVERNSFPFTFPGIKELSFVSCEVISSIYSGSPCALKEFVIFSISCSET